MNLFPVSIPGTPCCRARSSSRRGTGRWSEGRPSHSPSPPYWRGAGSSTLAPATQRIAHKQPTLTKQSSKIASTLRAHNLPSRVYRVAQKPYPPPVRKLNFPLSHNTQIIVLDAFFLPIFCHFGIFSLTLYSFKLFPLNLIPLFIIFPPRLHRLIFPQPPCPSRRGSYFPIYIPYRYTCSPHYDIVLHKRSVIADTQTEPINSQHSKQSPQIAKKCSPTQ
jgi:hypothetical protein